jgi:catechol 2,3-dioxygenase-like lactoylglutathione lyase family enzyme
MNSSIRHIALFVPDLRAAERYSQSIFDMELIGREAELADGLWYTLPFDKG